MPLEKGLKLTGVNKTLMSGGDTIVQKSWVPTSVRVIGF